MGATAREKVRGSGVWWVFWHKDGERGSKKIGTRKAAETFAALLKARMILGRDEPAARPDQNDTPFSMYAGLWLEKYIRQIRKPSTYERYEQILKEYVLPELGKRDIRKITRGHIRDLLLEINGRGLSKSTVGLVKDVVSGVFTFAMDDEVVTHNLTSNILRQLNLNRSKNPKMNPFSSDEVRHFLDVCWEQFPEEYPFFLCAFRTGMREGELLALEWRDIDWKGKFIRVRRTFRKDLVTDTKTGDHRNVDMSDELVSEMRNLHLQRKKEGLKAGTGKAFEIVFHRDMKHIPQNTVRRIFKRILQKAGLRKIRFHDIRHTYISLMLSMGANPVYVREQAGHKSSKMTDIYTKFIRQSERSEVNLLDDSPEKKTLSRTR